MRLMVREKKSIGLANYQTQFFIISFHSLNLISKSVARTSILSKRWNYIWRSIPTLDFMKPSSGSDIDKFIDFVDKTLLLRDPLSSIQTVYLDTDTHFNASRVHSWICNIATRHLQKLYLYVQLDKPFFLPVSLFKCESLTKLELTASTTTHFPKTLSFPKLQSLTLRGIQFIDDDCWNEQHFSNCPVLENLTLEDCAWSGMREFCILTPKLKHLDINNALARGYGLQDCHLKICAPSLVSLSYKDNLSKDYDLSTFATLDDAYIFFTEYDERSEQWIGYGAAVTKFFRAISHVKKLIISAERLQGFLDADDFANHLPAFHNLNELYLISGPANDNLIFALLKAAPNLESVGFGAEVFDDEDDDVEDDDIVYDETEELFRHLQSVQFGEFTGEGRELRWAKLILKNAKSLQMMTIVNYGSYAKGEQVIMSELSSLPRASGRCVFEC